MENRFIFSTLPQNSEELLSLPEASLDSPYKTAALAMLALLRFESDPEMCYKMLDSLRGPDPMTPFAKAFIKERLDNKAYKVKSFFEGATPENNYTPTQPYTIAVSDNPYSFTQDNWATVFVKSSGADAPRQIKLRKKPSTGQWFINDIACLSDIKTPVALDDWA